MDELLLIVHVAAGTLALLLWLLAMWRGGTLGAHPHNGLAFHGRLEAGRKGDRWRRATVHGQGGSYIALVTAPLVGSVMVSRRWPRALPTLVSFVLIEASCRRLPEPGLQ